MTSSIVEVDSDLIEVLDFEFELPCDHNMSGLLTDCHMKAEWKILILCCGVTIFVCDFHKRKIETWYKTIGVNHNACKSEDVKLMFDKI